MPEHSTAVFLSYASQDTEAAKRICEALRAAGVEVWFDQNELVGGDAWDQKIRKHIKDCALLIPIISQNTQSRTEGYFRLEWRLADQRTHLMAKGRPFLLPVVIDDTRDSDAQVPDSFTEVQWTKAPGGEVPAAFPARVKKLLVGTGHGAKGEGAEVRTNNQEPKTHNRAKLTWLIPAIAGAVAIAVATIWLTRKVGPTPTAEFPVPARQASVPVSEARKLALRADAMFDQTDNATRGDLDLAEQLCRQALSLDPADAEIHAIYARLLVNYVTLYDSSDERRTAARVQAEQAAKLAPESDETQLALANFYRLEAPTRSEAEKILRALVARRPEFTRAWRALGHTLRFASRYEEAIEVYHRAAALPGGDPLSVLNEAQCLLSLNRFVEAEASADRLIVLRPGRAAYLLKGILATWRGDFTAATAAFELIPADTRLDPPYAFSVARLSLWQRQPGKALALLQALPGEFLESAFGAGPKDFWVGLAFDMEGRPEAAATAWRAALQAVERRLAVTPTSSLWTGWSAILHARLGEMNEARRLFALVVQMRRTDDVYGSEFGLRFLAARLRDGERGVAIDELARVLQQRGSEALRTLVQYDPDFDQFRDEPWFRAAVETTATTSHQSTQSEKSVAVLAFANLSDDKANEYFSDGISEELLNVLAKVPGLKVSARTSSFHFKGKDTPIAEIAQKLGVAYVVEGSVRKQGDKVRITAQLVKAADGFHVWSDTFTRDLKDIFAVQDEIAALVAQNLQLKLGVSKAQDPVDPEVFQLYLESRRAWSRRTFAAMDEAEQLLTRALDRAPGFARGLAAMADVWWFRGHEAYNDPQKRSQEALLRTAETWLDRALSVDPNLAEAHATRGGILSDQGNFRDAENALRRALELNPNYATARQWYGGLLCDRGEFASGLRELELAVQLDPFAPMISSNHGMYLCLARRYADSLAAFDRVLAMAPDFAQALGWRPVALYRLGRREEAIPLLRERLSVLDATGTPGEGTFNHLVLLAESGAKGEAVRWFDRLLAASPEVRGMPAELIMALGRKEEALTRLAASGREGIVQSLLDPVWDQERESAEFLQVMEKTGVTAIYRQAWAQVQALQEKPSKP